MTGTLRTRWVLTGALENSSSLKSRDPNKRVSVPKYYNINGIRALKPNYFGPWTLRGLYGLIRIECTYGLRAMEVFGN